MGTPKATSQGCSFFPLPNSLVQQFLLILNSRAVCQPTTGRRQQGYSCWLSLLVNHFWPFTVWTTHITRNWIYPQEKLFPKTRSIRTLASGGWGVPILPQNLQAWWIRHLEVAPFFRFPAGALMALMVVDWFPFLFVYIVVVSSMVVDGCPVHGWMFVQRYSWYHHTILISWFVYAWIIISRSKCPNNCQWLSPILISQRIYSIIFYPNHRESVIYGKTNCWFIWSSMNHH